MIHYPTRKPLRAKLIHRRMSVMPPIRMWGVQVSEVFWCVTRTLPGFWTEKKIWEIRGRSTHIRGPILIIKSGTGQVFGTADLVRVLGPLELEDLVDASELPRQEREEFRRSGLPYPKTYAYVFSNPRRFNRPIPYRHPSGAVTWVRLPDVDLGAVRDASSPHGASEGDLLHVLATEIWPLLERILGDPTAT
jgi:hypothetical protein